MTQTSIPPGKQMDFRIKDKYVRVKKVWKLWAQFTLTPSSEKKKVYLSQRRFSL